MKYHSFSISQVQIGRLLFFDLFLFILLGMGGGGCSSYEQFHHIAKNFEVPQETFKADYNQTWLAVLQSVKKYDLELQDQKAGIIKTRWIDNTRELNFSDSFGSNDTIKAAKFKIIINIVKGFRNKKEVARVTVFRRQMIEKDFLQGWKIIPSDGIIEKIILYRTAREIHIRNKIHKIEEQKSKELEATF